MKRNDNQKTTVKRGAELTAQAAPQPPQNEWSVQGSNLRPPVYKGRRALGITPITEGATGQKSLQKTRQSAESPISNDNEKTTVVSDVASARDRVPAHLQFSCWKLFAAIPVFLVLAACENARVVNGKTIPCYGFNGNPAAGVKYEYSVRNIVVGLIFAEIIAPPVIVAFEELQCPRVPA